MKRLNFVFAAAVAATLLLSACNITITPPGPPPADVVLSSPGTPDAAAWSGSIAKGDDVVFKLTFPGAGAGHVVYLELDTNLRLQLHSPTNFNVVASSHGPDFYASGMGGLATASADDLSPLAIGVTTKCRGSCIIIPATTGSTYYARVINDSGSAVTTDLFFFEDVEQDLEEPNDDPADATPFDIYSSSGDSGTIELLGDADFWRVNADGPIDFSTAAGNPVDLRLAIVNSAGAVIGGPIGPGTINVFANQILKVYSASSRAGSPFSSQYTLLGQ